MLLLLVRSSLLLLVLAVGGSHAHDEAEAHTHETVVVGFDAETLAVTIPKPLSDFTAVLSADDSAAAAVAYVTGGCDAVNGNVWTNGEYACDSVSDTQYAFDLTTQTFTATAPLLQPRYRHGAALVNQQIWLLGGRDVAGELVTTVDMYDIASDVWTSFAGVDSNVTHVSDLAAFATSDDDAVAHFVGGYSYTYEAQTTHVAIDTVATVASGVLVVTELAPLPTARGDVTAVAVDGFALVTGGFTHANDFCDVLATTERYDVATDTWTAAADLAQARADKALVVLDETVYALGGERQIANICTAGVDPAVGEETVPVDDVEFYNAADNTWTVIDDLPRHRFRFSAIGWNEAIYAFGGQVAFNETCQCFATTDEVIVYTEVLDDVAITTTTASTSRASWNSPSSVAIVVAAMMLVGGFF